MSDNPSAAYLFFIAKKRQPEPELFRPFGVAVSAESVGDADILLGLASPTGLRGRASTNVAGSGASPSSDEKRKRPAKWDDAAEAVYFSVVSLVPPVDRHKIFLFGEELGRNQLIASVLTLCTNRYWDRKQVSSHHQQVKLKMHEDYQPLFTTADEIRSTSTERGKTIESFKFPDELLAVMGYHPGTDLAKAKLHPRLDDWYNGKAAAHEASLSPKARRTSDSSGTSGQTISSGQTASSAQSTSSGSTSRGPRSAPRIETQRKASRRIARPAAVSPAVQPFPLGRTLNFTYMPGHTSTTPHHSPYHSPSVGKLSPFTYEYPSPHLPIQPKLSISHIIHHPADEQ